VSVTNQTRDDALQIRIIEKSRVDIRIIDRLNLNTTGKQVLRNPTTGLEKVWLRIIDRIRLSDVTVRPGIGRGVFRISDSVQIVIRYPSVTLVSGPNITQQLPRTSAFLPPTHREKVFKGIALPTGFRKYPNFKTGIELIKDSVITILLTKKGQRFFIPDFGSDLWSAIFEPNDLVLQALVEQTIRTALGRWEPRITVQNIRMAANEHTLTVEITYVILDANVVVVLPLQFSRETTAFTAIA
jgi:phage baseplate assembly protein W